MGGHWGAVPAHVVSCARNSSLLILFGFCFFRPSSYLLFFLFCPELSIRPTERKQRVSQLKVAGGPPSTGSARRSRYTEFTLTLQWIHFSAKKDEGRCEKERAGRSGSDI